MDFFIIVNKVVNKNAPNNHQLNDFIVNIEPLCERIETAWNISIKFAVKNAIVTPSCDANTPKCI